MLLREICERPFDSTEAAQGDEWARDRSREIAYTSLLFTNLKWTREHTTTHSTQEGRAASMQRSLRGLTRIVNGRGTRTFRPSWSAKLDMCARWRVDWVCLMTLAQVPGHAPKKLRLTIDSLPLLVTSVSDGRIDPRATYRAGLLKREQQAAFPQSSLITCVVGSSLYAHADLEARSSRLIAQPGLVCCIPNMHIVWRVPWACTYTTGGHVSD